MSAAGAPLVIASETAAIPAPSRVPAHLRQYVFQPGHAPLPGAGRPRGSAASTMLERTETRLAKTYIKKALTPGKEQGTMLRHAMDKFVPNAGLSLDAEMSGVRIAVFIGAGELPRPLSVAAPSLALTSSQDQVDESTSDG